MPDVHIPKLDEHEEEEPTAAAARGPISQSHRSRSFVRIGLEVVLISAGVFLGLMGEQWRERSEHRELAEASLRRFRTEITTNRNVLASRKDYHATLKQELATYFDSDEPRTPARFGQTVHMTSGISPVFFEQAAWDLAIATQALAYIDADLAFALSRVYTTQQAYAELQRAIVQSTIYGQSWTQDLDGVMRSILNYMGDVSYFDPVLLKGYNEVLQQIERALGESPSKELR
jgi:hypothetical protein